MAEAADGLVKVQVALGNIASKRERIKILYKKSRDPDGIVRQCGLLPTQRGRDDHHPTTVPFPVQSEFITSNKSKIMEHRMYQHLHADIRTMFDGMLHTAKEIMEKSYTPGEMLACIWSVVIYGILLDYLIDIFKTECIPSQIEGATSDSGEMSQTYELGRTEGRPSLETIVLFFCKLSSYYFTEDNISYLLRGSRSCFASSHNTTIQEGLGSSAETAAAREEEGYNYLH
ncbi:dynactin subunit 3 [Chelonia mydas]|uniref:dynactin subunit 3 n=1 Tax=Chelonia mydas TaxID=8469 RepID=UPI001CA994E6|nr:dynactin subunit 3 [Chelonia mydas]